MKNLFDPSLIAEMTERIDHLQPDNLRLWGKMNAPQAMAHCSTSLEGALGDTRPPRMFIGRIIGRFVKRSALGNDEPIPRNTPTAPGFVVADDRDFATERTRLRGLLDRFAAAGPAGCTEHPHPFFGRLTPDEWAVLMYKHVDHHLRQFSA